MKSISNNQLKRLRKLNQKKYRREYRQFMAEGARAVEQIIQNNQLSIVSLFFDQHQTLWQHQPWATFVQKIPSAVMEERDFADVSDTDHPQGVLALCEMPQETAMQKLAEKKGLILATDALQDPGNLGTIIRTCSWFGVQGLLSGQGTVDLFHPKVVRSTAGATDTVPFTCVNLQEALPFFEETGWNILLLDGQPGSARLKDLTPQPKTILVVGNEAHGLDASLRRSSYQRVGITSPKDKSEVESLNAAIATSIALYALS